MPEAMELVVKSRACLHGERAKGGAKEPLNPIMALTGHRGLSPRWAVRAGNVYFQSDAAILLKRVQSFVEEFLKRAINNGIGGLRSAC
jgi:hypothetical protein